MRNQGIASLLSLVVLSACVLQGAGLPQQRYSVAEFEEQGRKLGSAKIDDVSNYIDDEDDSAVFAKEEGSLITTLIELAMKFVPILMDGMSSDQKTQKDGNDGVATAGDNSLSTKNLAMLGLKLFLTVVGGSGNVDRGSEDANSIMQPLMRAVIGSLIDSNDPDEADAMSKQAIEVINLVMTLVEALTTSMSQRGFY